MGVLLERAGVDQPVADEQFNLVDPEVACERDEIVATDEAATVALVTVGGVWHPECLVDFGDGEPTPDDAAQNGVQVFTPVVRVRGEHRSQVSTGSRSPPSSRQLI